MDNEEFKRIKQLLIDDSKEIRKLSKSTLIEIKSNTDHSSWNTAIASKCDAEIARRQENTEKINLLWLIIGIIVAILIAHQII